MRSSAPPCCTGPTPQCRAVKHGKRTARHGIKQAFYAAVLCRRDDPLPPRHGRHIYLVTIVFLGNLAYGEIKTKKLKIAVKIKRNK